MDVGFMEALVHFQNLEISGQATRIQHMGFKKEGRAEHAGFAST